MGSVAGFADCTIGLRLDSHGLHQADPSDRDQYD